MNEQMQQGGSKGGSTGLASNVASLLCYICPPITGIIFILIEKENHEVKFHAWQATIMGVAFIILMFGLQILAMIFGSILAILGSLVSLVSMLVSLALFVLWIVCLIKSYQGEMWHVPGIGDLAAKRAEQ